MRFWTVQPHTVWEKMQTGQGVRVDPDHPKYAGQRPWQYEWLAAALAASHPGFDGDWPWWLSTAEPDLVQQRAAALPGGSKQTLLELELSPERYVTFPLWMWETIHMGHYLAASKDEFDAWQTQFGEDTVVGTEQADRRLRLESSWQRLLDDEWCPQFWYRDVAIPDDGSSRSRLMRESSVETVGLTEELRSADVVATIEFSTNR